MHFDELEIWSKMRNTKNEWKNKPNSMMIVEFDVEKIAMRIVIESIV